MQPTWEVADVLNRLGNQLETIGLNTWQLRTLSALKKCRTAALGGHIDACDQCGTIRISYNSCRNRHCPKCQSKNREDWIVARETELLPVPYFHLVFTLPETMNPLAIYQPKVVYGILFEAAWETLKQFSKNKVVHAGMIAVLHTWGQNLSLHPHLHCIVPGGGITPENTWRNIRTDGNYLFPVKALSKVFRAKYCEKLKAHNKVQYEQIRQELWKQNWVVFAKKPFGTPKSVIEYLGRYTHKIAISNRRIKAIGATNVTFEYKDYRQEGVKKQMQLTHQEFVRRFALHILPKNFMKIRHYGFLSSTWKRRKLKELQQKLQVEPAKSNPKTGQVRKCPCCKVGQLHTIAVFDQRGPPAWYLGGSQTSIACKN